LVIKQGESPKESFENIEFNMVVNLDKKVKKFASDI